LGYDHGFERIALADRQGIRRGVERRTSTAVGVTVNNPTGTDISGWTVTQANATVVYTIPAGTVIPANGYVVIGRDATKAAFQTFWGVTLGSNVIYLTTAGAFRRSTAARTTRSRTPVAP